MTIVKFKFKTITKYMVEIQAAKKRTAKVQFDKSIPEDSVLDQKSRKITADNKGKKASFEESVKINNKNEESKADNN